MSTPADRPFRSSVFIATSLDGFIARENGDLDWLASRAEQAGDTGYEEFMDGVDTIAVGRHTYELALTYGEEGWPYAGKRVAVLSTGLAPGADPRITVYRDLDALVRGLTGVAKHVYADGGRLIRSFLDAGLLSEITVTAAPVLLGRGIPLFGPLAGDVALTHRATRVLGGGFVQSRYGVG